MSEFSHETSSRPVCWLPGIHNDQAEIVIDPILGIVRIEVLGSQFAFTVGIREQHDCTVCIFLVIFSWHHTRIRVNRQTGKGFNCKFISIRERTPVFEAFFLKSYVPICNVLNSTTGVVEEVVWVIDTCLSVCRCAPFERDISQRNMHNRKGTRHTFLSPIESKMLRAFTRTQALRAPGRSDVELAMTKWWTKKRPAEGQVRTARFNALSP